MRIEGEYTFGAPREQVWGLLHDPGALSRALPGVEQFNQVGPNEYEATVRAGVAAVRGTYRGRVKMADLKAPEQYTLNAVGQGSAGTFDATARITLLGQDGRTQLRYEADAQVGGAVAGVGQRMLGGVAKLMANQFFKAMEDQLNGQPTAAQAAAPAAAGVGGQPASTATSASAPVGLPGGLDDLMMLAGPVGPLVGAGLAGLLVGLLLGRRGRSAADPRASLAMYELAAALRDVASALRGRRR